MMVHNPIINDIKEKYSFAYELASIGLSAVCERLKVKITEDEISFFALHFILALERKREEVAPAISLSSAVPVERLHSYWLIRFKRNSVTVLM